MQAEISINTSKKQELVDITHQVQNILSESKIDQGICNIFCKHATGAIIINENYDPNICLDLLDSLNELIPNGKWRHDKVDGNADSHIKSAILGPSETLPITNNKLMLGKWQSIMFAELDGPRTDRKIVISTIGK